jgi:hypothetical protein
MISKFRPEKEFDSDERCSIFEGEIVLRPEELLPHGRGLRLVPSNKSLSCE